MGWRGCGGVALRMRTEGWTGERAGRLWGDGLFGAAYFRDGGLPGWRTSGVVYFQGAADFQAQRVNK